MIQRIVLIRAIAIDGLIAAETAADRGVTAAEQIANRVVLVTQCLQRLAGAGGVQGTQAAGLRLVVVVADHAIAGDFAQHLAGSVVVDALQYGQPVTAAGPLQVAGGQLAGDVQRLPAAVAGGIEQTGPGAEGIVAVAAGVNGGFQRLAVVGKKLALFGQRLAGQRIGGGRDSSRRIVMLQQPAATIGTGDDGGFAIDPLFAADAIVGDGAEAVQ